MYIASSVRMPTVHGAITNSMVPSTGSVRSRDEQCVRRGARCEVFEVGGEFLHVGEVADGQAVVFGLPVFAEETTVHPAQHRGGAVSRFDEPLAGGERAVGLVSSCHA